MFCYTALKSMRKPVIAKPALFAGCGNPFHSGNSFAEFTRSKATTCSDIFLGVYSFKNFHSRFFIKNFPNPMALYPSLKGKRERLSPTVGSTPTRGAGPVSPGWSRSVYNCGHEISHLDRRLPDERGRLAARGFGARAPGLHRGSPPRAGRRDRAEHLRGAPERRG